MRQAPTILHTFNDCDLNIDDRHHNNSIIAYYFIVQCQAVATVEHMLATVLIV